MNVQGFSERLEKVGNELRTTIRSDMRGYTMLRKDMSDELDQVQRWYHRLVSRPSSCATRSHMVTLAPLLEFPVSHISNYTQNPWTEVDTMS